MTGLEAEVRSQATVMWFADKASSEDNEVSAVTAGCVQVHREGSSVCRDGNSPASHSHNASGAEGGQWYDGHRQATRVWCKKETKFFLLCYTSVELSIS